MSNAWWTSTWLVAQREIRERTRAKSFRITVGIMVLAIVAAVVIPALVGGGGSASKVGTVGGDQAALAQTVRKAGKVLDKKVQPIPVASVAEAESRLKSGDLDVAVIGDQRVLIKQQAAKGVSSDKSTLAGAIAQLGGGGAAAAQQAQALPVRGLEPPPRDLATRLTGMGVVIVIYLFVFVYGQRITSGVGEEKSSRVVEVLLATVKPGQLLAGKVIGMGVAAVVQLALMIAAFLISALAVGSDVISGSAAGVAVVGGIWAVLGYALYCTAFAAAGSLITREADASNVTFPIVIPLIVAYAMSFSAIFGDPSGFFKVLAYIPVTAPVAMTTLYATGDAGVLDVVIAAAICLATTVVCARLAARVYEYSILRTGSRVPLREALRSSREPRGADTRRGLTEA
jgi:ABC-2 type transport system permease protein